MTFLNQKAIRPDLPALGDQAVWFFDFVFERALAESEARETSRHVPISVRANRVNIDRKTCETDLDPK